ncbi:hypothetical protein BGW80DRAFT_1252828 [Lactifluus volemus]|nr:hypothetical protein BGW80DRAFT_1252828 [Lactifluus volemus]
MLCLDVDSPVDDWYQTLDPVIRTDWDLLVAQFVKEWAQPPARPEKTVELLNLKLKPEDVGTMVLFRGAKQHAHIAWAHEMMVRVRHCGLESREEYIHLVRCELPSSIIDSIGRGYTTWSTFIEAVMAIDVDRLKERLELSKVMETMKARVKELEADFQWQERNRHAGTELPSKQQPAAHWRNRAG